MRVERRLALTVALTPLLLGFSLPGGVERMCARGNRLYAQGKYQEAADTYARALKARPDDPTLHYNQGTALYQAGNFQAADQALSAAMAEATKELQPDLHYNIGNTRYRLGDFKGAIEQYKQALRLNPDDAEAKYNLEMAQRKLKEQQEKQQEEEQKQEQQKDQEKQDKDRQQNQQQDREASQEEQEQQQAEQPQEQPAQQSQAGQATDEKTLSKEQAAALLRALAADDAAMQKIIRRAPMAEPRAVEKDW